MVWGRWVMWGMACKPRIKGIDKCGECRCRGLDLTKNHLKMEKKTKKKKQSVKKKISGRSGI